MFFVSWRRRVTFVFGEALPRKCIISRSTVMYSHRGSRLVIAYSEFFPSAYSTHLSMYAGPLYPQMARVDFFPIFWGDWQLFLRGRQRNTSWVAIIYNWLKYFRFCSDGITRFPNIIHLFPTFLKINSALHFPNFPTCRSNTHWSPLLPLWAPVEGNYSKSFSLYMIYRQNCSIFCISPKEVVILVIYYYRECKKPAWRKWGCHEKAMAGVKRDFPGNIIDELFMNHFSRYMAGRFLILNSQTITRDRFWNHFCLCIESLNTGPNRPF